MPRKPRDLRPHFPHHIWVRGNNRRRLFSDQRDHEQFLGLLREGLRESPVIVSALALLSNHYHLIATPAEVGAIPALMKYVNQRWAQARNQRRSGSGKLFEQSYGCRVLETPAQLVIATLYVEANPVTAGIVVLPECYRYSSYRVHAGGRVGSPLMRAVVARSRWVEALAPLREQQKVVYRGLMADYINYKQEQALDYLRGQEFAPPPANRAPRRPNKSRAS